MIKYDIDSLVIRHYCTILSVLCYFVKKKKKKQNGDVYQQDAKQLMCEVSMDKELILKKMTNYDFKT